MAQKLAVVPDLLGRGEAQAREFTARLTEVFESIPSEFASGIVLQEAEPFDFEDFTERISSTLEPKMNSIMVVLDQAPNKTKGGLVIPDKAQQTPSTGRICAKSGNLKDIYGWPICVELGQRVYVSKYGGSVINFDGVDVECIDVNKDVLSFFRVADGASVYYQPPVDGEGSVDE